MRRSTGRIDPEYPRLSSAARLMIADRFEIRCGRMNRDVRREKVAILFVMTRKTVRGHTFDLEFGNSPCTGAPVRILLAICRHIDLLNRWIGRATAWCILASVLISTANAVSRKAFGISSNSWVEMQWYLYAAAFLLAAGYVLLVDEHVRVDALAQRFSARLRARLDVVVLLIFVLPLCALMVDLGAVYTWDAYRRGDHSFMADGLFTWPVRLLIPLGFGLLGLQTLSEIVKRIDFLRGGRPRATTTEAEMPEFMGVAPNDGPHP